MPCFRQLAPLVLLVAIWQAGAAFAGGGPENLLLVVNQNSDASKTIANHYIRLRDLPPTNVLYLDWQGSTSFASGEKFREQLLKPIIATIDERKLAAQIEYVVYSSDFPYRIDFQEEFKDENLAKPFRPLASLTGATYLWIYALNSKPAMVMPTVNWFVPPAARANSATCRDCSQVPTSSFRARQFWTESGTTTTEPSKGQNYWLSSMLGVTIERGNTTDEVVRCLTRSAAADATEPRGTFYFMKNSDVRSKARHECYGAVVQKLRQEGAKAEVLEGRVPKEASSALGIMAGTASFSIDANNVSIAPGAICENLTSLGAVFHSASQTKLSAWIRAGAAGTSGTVAEPYAIQAKFPLPVMQLHYRRGASLGEAFYQSVSGPYQLLVVGDPLCQPWAKPPTVQVEGLSAGQTVSGVVEIKAKVTPKPGTEAELCHLYMDGRLIARYPYALPAPLNTDGLAPGRHELRMVVSTSGPLQFLGRAIVPFSVGSRGAEAATNDGEPANLIQIEVEPQPMVAAGTPVTVTVNGPENMAGFDILQNHRRVASVQGSSGSVSVDTALLGRGPVALVAQEATAEGKPLPAPASASRSRPVWFLVR